MTFSIHHFKSALPLVEIKNITYLSSDGALWEAFLSHNTYDAPGSFDVSIRG